ncbi:MAG: creatininase family protein, partial [Firmicutes bacterium]|nr:creatininase family protein [Bacillota bacterium]
MRWETLSQAGFHDRVPGRVHTVVWPWAGVMSHGPQLPLGSDGRLLGALAGAVEARWPDRLVLAPAVPVLPAWELAEWSGTLSVGPGAAAAYLTDWALSMLRWGLTEVVVLLAHEEAGGPLAEVGPAVADAGGRRLVFSLEGEWTPGEVGGREETAALLALDPQAV